MRTILPSKFVLYLFLFIVFIYSFIVIKYNLYYTKYSLKDHVVYGIIKDIKIDGNKLDIYISDLIVYYYCNQKEDLEKFSIGDKIKINGNLRKPSAQANFNGFDYQNYLLSKKIHYIVDAEHIELLKHQTNYLYQIKRWIIKKINNYKSRDYLLTFILGDNSYIDSSVKQSYQKIGISHLFAVSGMHVSLLTTILLLILNKICHHKFLIFSLLFTFLFFYLFLTNFSPSIMRATLLFIFCFLNKHLHLGIRNDYILLYILGLALLDNPFYVYNNGFVFSYVISYFLIKFGQITNNYHHYLSKLFMTSLISFLVSVPIMINSYFSINVLTPLYNLLFVPMVSLLIFPLAIITLFLPFFDSVLFILISLLEKLAVFFNQIKITNISLAHMNYLIFLFYYLIIIFIMHKLKVKEYKYIVIILIMLFLHHNINYFSFYPSLTFINVGQGDAILLKLPHNHNILIDCGNVQSYFKEDWQKKKEEYNVGDAIIVPYLQSEGINKLDYVIITHGDYDHIGSLKTILEQIRIEKVIFNSGHININEQKVMEKLKERNIPYFLFNQKELRVATTELFFLNDQDKANENEDSLVLYMQLNKFKILLMGDAGFETEKFLINTYNLHNMDILKVGHHGSKYSSSTEFLDVTNPKYAIISVGENNKFGHPDADVLAKLANSKTYLTSTSGAIKITFKSSLLVQTVR